MKKVLFFFPENPLEKNSGNKTRVLQLLHYFRTRNMEVDFVSVSPWTSIWSEKDAAALSESGLVSNVHVLSRKPPKKNLFSYLFSYKRHQLRYQRKTDPGKSAIPVHSNYHIQTAFEQLLKSKHYDYILISYVYWHHLISNKELTAGSKTIIDTHDFITDQLLPAGDGALGATFEDEIRRMSLFDEVWAISTEERYLFSQFCGDKVRLVPLMLDPPLADLPGPAVPKKFDLIYVASDNPHNVRAAKWFFDEVHPRLPEQVRLCVIGRINQHVGEYRNVTKIFFAEDLDEFYRQSVVALCPMFGGTGVKVKVVEALSYGLPVVCTQRGIDGLPNKSRNGCLVSDDPGRFAKHIISLLQDPALYTKQSRLATALFSSHFSTEKCRGILDKAFDS
ncbi:glycosyltransferase involved in cell wall biosynthesis [Anseongella ginsenosidimutans]|uniref:Glycosyltransferase involved in cell wall biosynthesis n=1 Tax=Anseongella ginsenosidimutans TaxID=496056 RepID=A0A4R3KNA1_9SPHI|nr:glycosyltransferase [Anseongella ginsenosidimutans]QEC51992.1 glycosyltransferase family 4 protein [Anseongella ginsenosidimutans]TCS85711.1 glycosyltransferase involved in cell wall biosynthesis [Anseongella ginsenosidimutans]